MRAIRLVVGIAIGIATLLGLWAGDTYGTLAPLVPPPQLNIFGRDYRTSAQPTSSRAEVDASHDGMPVDILEAAIGAWPFVPPWVSPAGGSGTPTVIWLRVGPDAYAAY